MRSSDFISCACFMATVLATGANRLDAQAVRLRAPTDTTHVAGIGVSVTNRVSWFQSANAKRPHATSVDVTVSPGLALGSSGLSAFATSAVRALDDEDDSPRWTNTLGLRLRRGSLMASLALGQDVVYGSGRRGAAGGGDTLSQWQRDSLEQNIGRPQNGGGFAPIPEPESAAVPSRPVLVGASVASVEWIGSRVSARLLYGIQVGANRIRQPWAGGDIHLTFGASTALIMALEQRSGPAGLGARATDALVAHVGVTFTALPWSRVRRTRTPGTSSGASSLEPAALAAFTAERAGDSIRIRVRSSTARLLEISGDLTGWDAMPMRASVGGWWEIDLPGHVGLHRIRVRVDGGEWLPPAGLPTSRDEFGEVSGVFVVQ